MNPIEIFNFATAAHEGQMYGEVPYIEHPKEAAEFAGHFGYPQDVIDGCYLHDVIEDTPVTAEELLQKGLPVYLVEAIEHVTYTKEDEVNGVDKIDKAMSSPLSHAIKFCDSSANERASSDPESFKHHKQQTYLENLERMSPRPTPDEVKAYIASRVSEEEHVT